MGQVRNGCSNPSIQARARAFVLALSEVEIPFRYLSHGWPHVTKTNRLLRPQRHLLSSPRPQERLTRGGRLPRADARFVCPAWVTHSLQTGTGLSPATSAVDAREPGDTILIDS